MSPRRLGRGLVALAALIIIAGCAGLLGADDRRVTETVTPAPVPEATADAVSTATTTQAPASAGNNTAVGYASLEPTCARPPGLVIHIQVDALASNNPETNDGIGTVWRFAAPSNKQYTGPYSNFERLIRARYSALLAAETISYDPLERDDRSARRRVTVTTPNGTSSTYSWQVEKQSTGQFKGCWMTTAVREVETFDE